MKRGFIGGMMLWGAFLTCQAIATAADQVDPSVLQAEAERVAVVAKASEAAVAIFADGGQGGGSGVVISADGYALSNFHVTKGAGDAMKCGMSDGKLYDAVIVGIDPVGDVALVKLLGREDFPHAELGDSDRVELGDWVFAIGNPFLLATDFHPTVTYGIVSGVHRYQYPAGTLLEYADCIQTDASINPGNSGGPLFNAQGQLIGINGRGSFEKRGRVNVGVGYAISINQIKNFMGYLRSGRIVDHATLGATLASDAQGRVRVSAILDDSDAARRGLREGDEIVSFGGRNIRTVNAFKNALGIYPKGWQVPLTFRRNGESHEILVRLAGVHNQDELVEKTTGRKASEGQKPRPDREEPDDPETPKPDKSKKPSKGRPLPGAEEKPKAKPMPDLAKRHFESRHGYANYYFNQLNRSRVWNKFVSRGNYESLKGTWTLKGQLLTGGDAEFRLSDTAVRCVLPGGQLDALIGDSLANLSDPPGSGGLLAALHVWRRLLMVGPEKFGEMYYLGTMPMAGHPGQVDVLVGRHGGIETRFLFDEQSGQLLKQETYLRANEDPCELVFSQIEEINGRWLPRQIAVQYGDQPYAAYKFSDYSFNKPAE